MKTVNLSQDDIRLVEQTLQVPFGAFGNEVFRQKLGNQYLSVESLYREMKNSIDNSNFALSRLQVGLLLKSFLFARDIADPKEFHTLTGFSWEDSDNLLIKMIDFISEERQ